MHEGRESIGFRSRPSFEKTPTPASGKPPVGGKGRALDNVMVERLWRTVKYEEEYLKSYRDMVELRAVPLQNRQPGPTTAVAGKLLMVSVDL